MSSRLVSALVFGVFASCGGGSGYGSPAPTGPNVTAGPVASIAVTPATASVPVGGAAAFTATMKDASGATVTGTAAAWSTSNPSIAAVDALSGIATGMSAGNATIYVTAAGKSGSAALTVSAPMGTGYARR